MFYSFKPHSSLFPKHKVLKQVQLASLNSFQESSLMKLHHPTLTEMTQTQVPQSGSIIIIRPNRCNSANNNAPQQPIIFPTVCRAFITTPPYTLWGYPNFHQFYNWNHSPARYQVRSNFSSTQGYVGHHTMFYSTIIHSNLHLSHSNNNTRFVIIHIDTIKIT